MKKALLPALVAAAAIVSATSAVHSAERELLFGPGFGPDLDSSIKEEPKKRPSTSRPSARRDSSASVKKSVPSSLDKSQPVLASPSSETKEPAKSNSPQIFASSDEKNEKIEKSVTPVIATKIIETPVKREPDPSSLKPSLSIAEVAPAIKPDPNWTPSPNFVMPKMPVFTNNEITFEQNKPKASVYVSEGRSNAIQSSIANDVFAERDRLAEKTSSSVTVGFFPSITGNQDTFTFQLNFLPLANYLSSSTGSLVNFVPERNLDSYRQRIAENRYPIIFINASLVSDALRAGYVPIAVGSATLKPGFLVKSESKLKSIDDINGVNVAWSINAQISMLAMYELAQRKLEKSNSFEDVGSAGRTATVSALDGGAAEVAVLRSIEVDKIVKESDGKYRSLGEGIGFPASGIWVRQNLKDDSFIQKFSYALASVKPDAQGSARDASDGFHRGFGVEGAFRPVSQDEIQKLSDVIKTVESAFPQMNKPVAFDAQVAKANEKLPVLVNRTQVKSNDAMIDRSFLVSTMKESLNVGFFVASSTNRDIYGFNRNFLPLANHLSEQTGVLVNLLPERNAFDFIRRIGDNEYPAIVIGPSLAHAALSSGYLPVSRAGEFVSPGFLVPAQSKIEKIEDLAGVRIATVRTSDAATVGRWELLKKNVKNARFDFFGSSVEGPGVLLSGAAQAILTRSTEAIEMAKSTDADGKLRFRAIIGNEEVPALSVWIRHDAYDFPLMRSFADAFSSFGPGGSSLQAKAFDGYMRGFDVADNWQISGIEEHTSSVQMIDGLISSKQSLVGEVKINSTIVDLNRAKPITFPIIPTISTFSRTDLPSIAKN